MKFKTATVTSLMVLASIPAIAETCDAPVPDVSVAQPGARVPAEYRGFAVALQGKWDGLLCHYAVVTNIGQDGSVSAVYAWGDAEKYRITKGQKRATGRIEENRLNPDIPADDERTATYAWAGNHFEGVYRRPSMDVKSTATWSGSLGLLDDWPPSHLRLPSEPATWFWPLSYRSRRAVTLVVPRLRSSGGGECQQPQN